MALSTFSIVAADPTASEVGVALQSKFLAAGAGVPWARGAVGAVATQALAEMTFGPKSLDLLVEGKSPEEIVGLLLDADDRPDRRQLGIVNAAGRAASYTGSGCQPEAMSLTGEGFAVQGNLLASAEVVEAMAESFQSHGQEPLAERMVEALRAGQRAGGDVRGQESAALLVAKPGGGYGGNHDRYIDLRVDHDDDPIDQLGNLLALHRFYFQRCLDSEVIQVGPELEEEISTILLRVGRLREGRSLWDNLFDYIGWENLEGLWRGPGRIDPKVLRFIREKL